MEEYLGEIGALVVCEAQRMFEEIGMGREFGIQAVGANVVFGGTPRVLWNPVTGFKLDKPYCSADFIARWEAAHGG